MFPLHHSLRLISFVLTFSFAFHTNAAVAINRFSRQSPRDPCPIQCGFSGSIPASWTVYRDLNTLNLCQRPLLLDFLLDIPLDQDSSTPRIRACSVWGDPVPSTTTNAIFSQLESTAANATVKRIQVQTALDGSSDAVRALSHLQKYIQNAPITGSNSILFARQGTAAVGYFGGSQLNNHYIAESQVCGEGQNAQNTWGVAIALGSAPLPAAQAAVNTWSKGSCVQETSVIHDLVDSASSSSFFDTTQSVMVYSTQSQGSSTNASTIQRRDECTTEQVVSGDSCALLAERCGTLPDLSPEPNEDDSCATYTIVADDSCSAIAAAYDLTTDEIESFNSETWGWNGCDTLWVPGPEAPTKGTALADLNPCPLNACCDIWGQCGITAEFCTESETESGAPGTAAAGENGCISNCGTDIVISDAPETYRQVAYFEGHNLDRPCLYMDASQLDTDTLTHILFAFGTLTEDFQVGVGNERSTFEFERFKLLYGPSRVLSIGGWSFSTDPGTYAIFRNTVQSENVDTATTNIANFITDNGLDGVDIDWEYPGAPDIPDIPAGADDEGELYTEFLTQLKSKLRDKTVSIAAPASYWYLRPYEMEAIGELLDYIVFMIYDLHGQWDYDNSFASEGCDTGNVLRSHINKTENKTALAMITKAGVPSGKVVIGVSSYGRSFKMTSTDCTGPDCTYVGSESGAFSGRCTQTNGYIANGKINEIIATNPTAQTWLDDSDPNILVYNETEWVAYMDEDNKADRDTTYAGYNRGGSVNWAVDLADFHDVPTDAYEEEDDGTHVLLETWSAVIALVDEGTGPFVHEDRNGNWTNLTCSDLAVQGALDLTARVRWSMLDCDDAWADAVQIYRDYYPNEYFTTAISHVYHGPEQMECGNLSERSYCSSKQSCTTSIVAGGSGPAGYEVLNSLISIQAVETDFLYDLDVFFDTFSPISDYTMAFFNSRLFQLFSPVIVNRLDTAKDIAYTAVDTWVNIAKDSNAGDYGWGEEDEMAFKSYMGSIWKGWKNSTELASRALFNGSESTVALLTKMMKDSKLIEGSSAGNEGEDAMSATEQRAYMAKSFYAHVIPQVWQKSGQNVFVVDTGGLECDDDSNPVSDYLDDSTAETTQVCFNKKKYYLVHLYGDASNSCQDAGNASGTSLCFPYTFSVPPGLETMGTPLEDQSEDAWGGLEPLDIVASTVSSYNKNNGKSGWSISGLSSYETLQEIEDAALITENIRAAGHNTLPVCSAEEAFANWGVNMNLENYPCNDE
ncbi:hypothetical protein BDV19DRAFT_399433 [Aspergillus venezuelensis]